MPRPSCLSTFSQTNRKHNCTCPETYHEPITTVNPRLFNYYNKNLTRTYNTNSTFCQDLNECITQPNYCYRNLEEQYQLLQNQLTNTTCIPINPDPLNKTLTEIKNSTKCHNQQFKPATCTCPHGWKKNDKGNGCQLLPIECSITRLLISTSPETTTTKPNTEEPTFITETFALSEITEPLPNVLHWDIFNHFCIGFLIFMSVGYKVYAEYLFG